jgi:hypothetical protein
LAHCWHVLALLGLRFLKAQSGTGQVFFTQLTQRFWHALPVLLPESVRQLLEHWVSYKTDGFNGNLFKRLNAPN